jgi:thiol-disulfide isomerase/thioredoxin
MMSDTIEDLDETSFVKAAETSDKLVIVEFFNTTCPSCQAIAPVYSALSKELGEHAVFAKVNAQQNMELAMRFGIMATPTFKFFCKGMPVGELVGAVNETMLRNTIKDLIRHRSECISKSTKLVYEIDGYA